MCKAILGSASRGLLRGQHDRGRCDLSVAQHAARQRDEKAACDCAPMPDTAAPHRGPRPRDPFPSRGCQACGQSSATQSPSRPMAPIGAGWTVSGAWTLEQARGNRCAQGLGFPPPPRLLARPLAVPGCGFQRAWGSFEVNAIPPIPGRPREPPGAGTSSSRRNTTRPPRPG